MDEGIKNRAVVAIVNYNGLVLIGKKRKDSHKFLAGEWHIPGENVEGDESDEEALIRGMREEASLDIRIGEYIASHKTPTSRKEARWYECFADTNEVKCGSDLEELKWVTKNEVLKTCSERAYSLWPREIIEYFS